MKEEVKWYGGCSSDVPGLVEVVGVGCTEQMPVESGMQTWMAQKLGGSGRRFTARPAFRKVPPFSSGASR